MIIHQYEKYVNRFSYYKENIVQTSQPFSENYVAFAQKPLGEIKYEKNVAEKRKKFEKTSWQRAKKVI